MMILQYLKTLSMILSQCPISCGASVISQVLPPVLFWQSVYPFQFTEFLLCTFLHALQYNDVMYSSVSGALLHTKNGYIVQITWGIQYTHVGQAQNIAAAYNVKTASRPKLKIPVSSSPWF